MVAFAAGLSLASAASPANAKPAVPLARAETTGNPARNVVPSVAPALTDLRAFEPNIGTLSEAAVALIDTTSTGDLNPKYLVPDSPAFAILGVTGDGAIHAQSPREFAVGVLNGLDKDGNLQNGMAIEWAPFAKSETKRLFGAFKEDDTAKALSRFALSFATTHGESDPDKSLRMAFGVRATIFDAADTRASPVTRETFIARSAQIAHKFQRRFQMLAGGGGGTNDLIRLLRGQIGCLKELGETGGEQYKTTESAQSCPTILSAANISSVRSDFTNEMRAAILDELDYCEAGITANQRALAPGLSKDAIEAVRTCKEEQLAARLTELAGLQNAAMVEIKGQQNHRLSLNEARAEIWNKSNWAVGLAPVWISKDGKSEHLHPAGLGAYSSAAYGFGTWFQAVLSGLYRSKDLVEDPTDETKKIEQDTTNAALEIRIGDTGKGDNRSDPDFVFSATADYTHADRKTMADMEYWTLSAGADIRLVEDLVLKLSIGGETNRKDSGESTFVLGKLKWGFN
jgi:hypothetical protein